MSDKAVNLGLHPNLEIILEESAIIDAISPSLRALLTILRFCPETFSTIANTSFTE